MFGIGGFELFIIVLFAFLILGPDKLPEMARMAGKGIAKFKSAQAEMNKVVKEEIYDPISTGEPAKNPVKEIDKENKEKIEKKESFSARKAKYDKQRAEQKKREAAAEAARETRAQAASEAKAAEEATAAAGADAAAKIAPTGVTAAAVARAKANNATATETHKRVMEARKEATAKAEAENEAKAEADAALADELLGVKKAPARRRPVAPVADPEKPIDTASLFDDEPAKEE